MASPPPPPRPDDPVERLRATHQAEGIAIGPLTAYPRWDGTPADYDQAVLCLVAGEGP